MIKAFLMFAFGDKKGIDGVEKMFVQACKAGAVPNDWMITPIAGCV